MVGSRGQGGGGKVVAVKGWDGGVKGRVVE